MLPEVVAALMQPGDTLPDLLVGVTEPWRAEASCQGADPALFFLARGAPIAPARRICAECPVRAECLAYALNDPDLQGIWAGTTERERARMRRQVA